ncbi:MAG: 50S ribosomal protein L3 [Planctomycetes bacterium]|nr:50S ribosomal protein L3 [Planctomycetota bacterium]
MTLGLLGMKVGMTRVIDERGGVSPVTVVKAGPCVVLGVRSKAREGYDAVQLGFGDVKPHRSTMPMIGHAARANTGPKRFIREIRLDAPAEVQGGDVLTVDVFSKAAVGWVDVIGTTKGKGFQGVMKRHGFGGMCASHGTERKHRSPGGIGANAPRGTGQSVKKGKRMAGHMGDVRRTASSLRLVKVDAEHDLLLIEGSVPGPVGGMVVVRKAVKKG